MALDERDYMNRRDSKSAAYSPRQFRRDRSNADFWLAVQRGGSPSAWRPVILALALVAFGLIIGFVTGRLEAPGKLSELAGRIGLVLPEPFPPPGLVRYYAPVDEASLAVKVSIRAQAGDARFKHVLRVRQLGAKTPFVDVYLSPGESMDVWLPQGRFIATSFVGDRWYGIERLFGDRQPGRVLGEPIVSIIGRDYQIELGSPAYHPRPLF